MTLYLDKNAVNGYGALIGKVFALTYPDISNKTAQNLGLAVAQFESNYVKTALEYQQTVPNAGDLFVSLLFQRNTTGWRWRKK